MRKKRWFFLECAGAVILLALAAAPMLYVLAESFWVDGGFSAMNYYQVLLASPRFLLRFWKSLALSGFVVAGQVLVSTLAGYGIARYKFKGKSGLLYCLMVLMMLPVQIILVANYSIFFEAGLTDTYWALVLPAMFIPLGTLVMANGFSAIPEGIFEAAELDGCGPLGVVLHIAAPLNWGGLCCTMLLSFLDAWNMVEQPIAYLSDTEKWPLAVALATSSPSDPGVRVACCVLAALPVMLLCLWAIRGFTKQDMGGGM